MDIRAESYSIITNKNKIIMGFAISFMAMFLAMNLCSCTVRKQATENKR